MVHRRLRVGAPTAPGAPIRNQSTKVNQMTTQVHNEDLLFTVHVFKEGDVFIAHVPQLDVSSCGDTATSARRNIQDAGQPVVGNVQRTRDLNGDFRGGWLPSRWETLAGAGAHIPRPAERQSAGLDAPPSSTPRPDHLCRLRCTLENRGLPEPVPRSLSGRRQGRPRLRRGCSRRHRGGRRSRSATAARRADPDARPPARPRLRCSSRNAGWCQPRARHWAR